MTREVRCCHQDELLHLAADAMWEGDCGGIPVLASPDEPRLVGFVTDRDACMGALAKGRALHEIPIRQVMASPVHTCHVDQNVREAANLMRRAEIRRLPVVDDEGLVVGMLSLADLAQPARAGKPRPLTQKELSETLAATSAPRSPAEGSTATVEAVEIASARPASSDAKPKSTAKRKKASTPGRNKARVKKKASRTKAAKATKTKAPATRRKKSATASASKRKARTTGKAKKAHA